MPAEKHTQHLFELYGDIHSPGRLAADPDSLTERYGRFSAQPFERGLGTTIGNSLRRTLLASIEGAAITAVKIEGVEHEFASIKGVVEDATDVILNLKQVPFKLHIRGPKTVRIAKEGAGEVTSADIETDADVEILDPSIHIANIDEGGSLNVEMRIKRARGYVSAERNFDEDLELGFIPTDSVHTPVKKVNYTVDPTRVGEDEFDKLTIDIWTDGSVRPEDALALAANLIKEHMSVFINFEEITNEDRPLDQVEQNRYHWFGHTTPLPDSDQVTGRNRVNNLLDQSPDFSRLLDQLGLTSELDLTPTVREAVQEESTARNYVTHRYRSLIDRKYLSGLSPSENEELQALRDTLEEMDKPYYEAIVTRLRNLIEQNQS